MEVVPPLDTEVLQQDTDNNTKNSGVCVMCVCVMTHLFSVLFPGVIIQLQSLIEVQQR